VRCPLRIANSPSRGGSNFVLERFPSTLPQSDCSFNVTRRPCHVEHLAEHSALRRPVDLPQLHYHVREITRLLASPRLREASRRESRAEFAARPIRRLGSCEPKILSTQTDIFSRRHGQMFGVKFADVFRHSIRRMVPAASFNLGSVGVSP